MSATSHMRCHDAAPYLSALLDGELAEPMQGAVAAHVAACAACRHRLDRLARTDRLVASLPASAPAPDLLDRMLATAQQRHPGPVLRESLRHRNRRRVVRTPPVFLLPDTPGVPPARPVARRPLWVTAALPALAALLILSMTLVVFHRLPSSATTTTSTARTLATPVALGTAIEQTQQAVEKYAAQLPFTPALPTYLPPNAQSPAVTVGPANVGIGSRVLDVVWKWSCATCTVSEVHLREAPLPLEARNDWGIAPAEPGLSWQVPGANVWRPGTLQDRTDLGRWAVGQDRADFSITLDVAGTTPTAGQPSDVETSALRLISLSMDIPYVALTVTPPNFASTVVRFTARSLATGVTWDALVEPDGLESVTASDGSGQSPYRDVSNGTTVLRLDTGPYVYATLPVTAAADPTFSAETQQFFLDANTALSYGALWPLPGTVTFDGVPAVRLFLVGAPHPTYVYVQPSTLRVLGASVDYSSPLRPGGPGATSKLTPSSGCPDYLQVSFQPWNGVPGSAFSMTPPRGYTPGAVPRSLTC